MRTFYLTFNILCVIELISGSLAYSQQSNDSLSTKVQVADTAQKTDAKHVKDNENTTKTTLVADSSKQSAAVLVITNATDQTTSERYDTIVKKTGGKMKVRITGRNVHEVVFIMPGENKEKKLSAGYIKELHYADGRVELIDNTPEKQVAKDATLMIPESEWKKVEVAKSEVEVKEMVEKEVLEAEVEGKKFTTTDSFLEKNATVILRKKAVNIKATKILIVDKIVNREYGEYPKMKVIAKAYAKE